MARESGGAVPLFMSGRHGLRVLAMVICAATLVTQPAHTARADGVTDMRFAAWNYEPYPEFSYLPRDLTRYVFMDITLPVCALSDESDCLESVAYRTADGTLVPGELQYYIPSTWSGPCVQPIAPSTTCDASVDVYSPSTARITVPADPAHGIPAGSRAAIFRFPGLSHAGGQDFLVAFTLRPASPGGQDYRLDYTWGDLVAVIIPVIVSHGEKGEVLSPPANRFVTPREAKDPENCFPAAGAEPIICLTRSSLETPTYFAMTTRLDLTSTAIQHPWLTGRVVGPEVTIDRSPKRGLRLILAGTSTMSGDAVSPMPRTEENYRLLRYAWMRGKSLISETQTADQVVDMSGLSFWQEHGYMQDVHFFDSIWISGYAYNALTYWRLLEPHLTYTAVNRKGAWTFQAPNTAYWAPGASLGACNPVKEFGGVTATNATVWEPRLPEWDPVDKTVTFTVASAHADEQGNVVQGTYDLVLSTSVVQCLWGADALNARASISVVSDGTEQTNVTSATRVAGGYFHFGISGFHYSEDTIRIRMLPTAAPTPSPSASTSAIPQVTPTGTAKPTAKPAATPKKITITCTKGRSSKKVTAVKPKCPTGWKRA